MTYFFEMSIENCFARPSVLALASPLRVFLVRIFPVTGFPVSKQASVEGREPPFSLPGLRHERYQSCSVLTPDSQIYLFKWLKNISAMRSKCFGELHHSCELRFLVQRIKRCNDGAYIARQTT